MAKGMGKFKEWIGIGDEFEEDIDEEIEEEQEELEEIETVKKAAKKPKKNPVTPSYSIKKGNYDASLVVLKPESFEDSKDICDKLKQRKGVYVNLEGTDKVLAQRIVDFIGGSVYALEGNIKKVSSAGFIVVPDNISISSDLDEKEETDNDSFNWMK